MKFLAEFATSSIGKKVQMAVTGLLLCGFLVTHLAGNLFLFGGKEAFNHYAGSLAHNPLLPLAEAILALLFLIHIVAAIVTRRDNWAARPQRYQMYRSSGGRTWGSSTMTYTALIVLAFLVVHLKSFRLQPDREDLYGMVVAAFRDPAYSIFYIVAMAALALHLSHGFQAGFRSLGLAHPKYTPWVVRFGWLFAIVICAGFAAMPLWIGFLGGGQ